MSSALTPASPGYEVREGPRLAHVPALPVLALVAMTVTWALLLAMMRWPMGHAASWAALRVSLLAGAVMLTWREAANRVLRGTWPSYAFALLAVWVVLFSPALVWVAGTATTPWLDLVLAGIWIAGLRGMMRDLATQSRWRSLAAVLAGAALGLVYFFYVNTKGYGTVFSPEQTLLGTQHRDTLYHASIAAMLGRFAVASTGLDGPVPLHYHFLSHALIGVTGRWTGVPPIHAYYLTHQILNLPLLFFALVAASCWLWRAIGALREGLLPLLVPVLLLATFEIWEWGSYLVSESFALGLALLLLTLPLVMEIQERPRVRVAAWRSLILALGGAGVLLTKNSIGVLLAGAVVYLAARAHRFRLLPLTAYAVGAGVIAAIGLRLTTSATYSTQPLIGPLHFFRSYPTAAWPNFWAIALSLGAAAWAWRTADRSRRLDLETLGVIGLASLAAGLLLQMAAGAAYYFMDVGVWTGFVLATAVALPRLARMPHQDRLAGIIAALILIATIAQPDKRHAGANLVALADTIAAQVAGSERATAAPSRQDALAFLSPHDATRQRIADSIRQTPGARLQQQLAAAQATVDAVFVPPDNVPFWRLSTIVCTAQPFFVPAVSTLPLVHGLPPSATECPLPVDTGYGYNFYPDSARSAAMSETMLCTALADRGFRSALVLDSPDASRVVRCPPLSGRTR